jgi:hypothetical protein
MDKVVELHPDGRAVVNMGFGETSVEARNFLAQIGHLVRYNGSRSRRIVFQIDSRSIRQAAEWGMKRTEVVVGLLRISQLASEYTAKDLFWFWLQFYQWPWEVETSREMGNYSRWFSHISPFGKKPAPDFWTKLRVAQNIWINKACGRRIGATDLSRGAQRAIYRKKVGAWNNLVKFAGYDPDAERGHEDWSREKIIKELQEMKQKGESISPGHWRSSLAQAVFRHFDSSDDAIKAAGFNPVEEREHRWTKDEIIACLRELYASGESIDWTSLKENHPSLSSAISTHFGSWQKAALAAGFDPDGDWPGQKAIFGRRYTVEEVLEYIILGHARNDKLTAEAVRGENWGMLCSGEEHFGTWNASREAAGLDLIYPVWSRTRITSSLQTIKANGEPINAMYLADRYTSLGAAIYRHFNSWDEAVQTAGFDPEEERLVHFWTDEEILNRLKDRKEKGESIAYSDLRENDRTLLAAMRTHFGSWTLAVRAAGFDPEEEQRHENWSAEKILKELKNRKQRGEPINYAALSQALVGAIRRYFGSWAEAVIAAGFDPEEEREQQAWSRGKIAFELQRLKSEGKPIYQNALPGSLAQAIGRHFDSWEDAVRAAGFDPEQEVYTGSEQARQTGATWEVAKTIKTGQARKYRTPTKRYSREGVLQWIQKRHTAGEKITQQEAQKADRFLIYSANDHFGSWNDALLTVGIVPPYERWSRIRVISTLQELKERGESISHGYIVSNYPRLDGGMRRNFDSWAEAVRAAGFNPDEEADRSNNLKERRSV